MAKSPKSAKNGKKNRTDKSRKLDAKQLDRLFDDEIALFPPKKFDIPNPKRKGRTVTINYQGWEAFLPPEPKLPKGYKLFGGLPYKIDKDRIVPPALHRLPRNIFDRYPWQPRDWINWGDLLPRDPCRLVASKLGVVEIPVTPWTRMGRVSGDCARMYTMSNLGSGCVVNVVTETVDQVFTVTPNPNPNPPYPPGITPVVHPFTLGGINHKYKRLYVPSSFVTTARSQGGFYVAVVDVNPASPTYLDTLTWINCGWIPEEVAFTSDNETGVIANYMQGTATVFKASDNSILAAEIEGFPGAAGDPDGGAFSRSVAVGNVPGRGNRAFLTLSSNTPQPGLAMFDLDAPGFPRTNIALPGGALGVAMTPDHRHVLAFNFGGSLHVIKVDQAAPVIERTINLPTAGRSYWAGIAVRPSGDLAFLATGGPAESSGQDSLVQVNYVTGTVMEIPSGLAPGTWNIDIKSLGPTRKPHLFVTSTSGMVTIIPC